MITKIKKNYYTLIIFIIILSFLSSISLFYNRNFLSNTIQELRIYSCQPYIGKNDYKSQIKNLFSGFLNYIKFGCDYPKMKFNIAYESIDKLNKTRNKALQKKYLSNPEYIPAEIIWDKKKYNAKIKLKGDLIGHWKHPKQWSFKISLKDKKSINTFREFSITKFEERQFPGNLFLAKYLSDLNIITPKFLPIKVYVNGDYWGPMLLEEQYSNSFLELRQKKETPIFRLTDDNNRKIYSIFKNSKLNQDLISEKMIISPRKFEVSFYNFNKYIYDPVSLDNISIIRNLNENVYLNEENTDELVIKYLDIEKFAALLAHTLVLGDFHSTKISNLRFYWNPYTLKIEPIPTDHIVNHTKFNNKSELYKNLDSQLSPIYKVLINSEIFKNEFKSQILKAKNIIENRSYLDQICLNYIKVCNNFFDTLTYNKNLDILIKNNFNETNFVSVKKNNQYESKKILDNTRKFYLKELSNYKDINIRIFNNGLLKVVNYSPFQLKIENIEFLDNSNIRCSDQKINIDKIIEPFLGNLKQNEIYMDFDDNIKQNCIYNKIKLTYILNKKLKHASTFVENSKFINNTINENEENPTLDFLKSNGNDYIIEKGNYNVNSPIVIKDKRNLIISSGVNLNFAKNTFIYIKNGDLIIDADNKDPVNLFSLKDPWNGIYVFGSKNKTILKNTKIYNVQEFDNNLYNLTGALNFYSSKINIDNLELYNVNAEDCINFVKSSFNISNSKIYNCKSDGIDSDFSNGKVSDTLFKNIGGDAFDTSGSYSNLENINFNHIGDKGLSIGEISNVSINEININDSKIGIASKDESIIKGTNVMITNSLIADLAAYQKKSFFGKSSVKIDSLTNNGKILSQKGNTIEVNKKLIKNSEFSTESLYR